jgi:hypothetical protein
MGDFERTFGAGADVDRIISRFSDAEFGESRSFRTRQRPAESSKKELYFETFDDALAWEKANPRIGFVRRRRGDGYLVTLD